MPKAGRTRHGAASSGAPTGRHPSRSCPGWKTRTSASPPLAEAWRSRPRSGSGSPSRNGAHAMGARGHTQRVRGIVCLGVESSGLCERREGGHHVAEARPLTLLLLPTVLHDVPDSGRRVGEGVWAPASARRACSVHWPQPDKGPVTLEGLVHDHGVGVLIHLRAARWGRVDGGSRAKVSPALLDAISTTGLAAP